MAHTHSSGFLKLTQDAAKRVREISVQEVLERIHQPNTFLVDVREESEWHAGHAVSAIHLSKGTIERDIETRIPDKNAVIMCYCGGGYRSLLAADNLLKMGYTNVLSVAGGYRAWLESNLPVTRRPEVLPRSPGEKLGGIVLLPRVIDLARMIPQGKLPGYDYLDSGLARALLDFLCIEPVVFEEIVRGASNDTHVLNALKIKLGPAWPSDNAIAEFNHKMERRKPEGDPTVSRFHVGNGSAAAPKRKIETLFEQIDWEEGRL
jgi:rhodanese-related sulfurtransferase